jgi:hypothetical protein
MRGSIGPRDVHVRTSSRSRDCSTSSQNCMIYVSACLGPCISRTRVHWVAKSQPCPDQLCISNRDGMHLGASLESRKKGSLGSAARPPLLPAVSAQ